MTLYLSYGYSGDHLD